MSENFFMPTVVMYPDYAETIRHTSENTDSLKDVLAAFGFERSDLKTLSFNVDSDNRRNE